ncbi:MAG: hypothetical protein ABJA11_10415 [Pseudolysinimonas sp.]
MLDPPGPRHTGLLASPVDLRGSSPRLGSAHRRGSAADGTARAEPRALRRWRDRALRRVSRTVAQHARPLPGTLKLVATDTDASWFLASDWSRPDVAAPIPVVAAAVIEGPAGELALLCWERAEALGNPKLTVSGSPEVARAFDEAPIHR